MSAYPERFPSRLFTKLTLSSFRPQMKHEPLMSVCRWYLFSRTSTDRLCRIDPSTPLFSLKTTYCSFRSFIIIVILHLFIFWPEFSTLLGHELHEGKRLCLLCLPFAFLPSGIAHQAQRHCLTKDLLIYFLFHSAFHKKLFAWLISIYI